jgi:4-diphosphocytidyl-2-C-methyl-D-erythritol kinase
MAAVKLLAERAPAKINLFLRVVGRRADGYHELDSVFVPISLADRLRIEIRPQRAASVALRCSDATLPADDRNLAMRAANAFMREFGVDAELLIDLEKNIPVGAGLGGGSSDAGAVLRMLASLERVGDRARLAELAASLGADVPFFLDPRPARIGGIGERISFLPRLPSLSLVLAVPPFEVSTREIFKALAPGQWSGPVADADIAALVKGEIAGAALVNDLAAVAMRLFPEIARIKSMLETLGARAAQMTGSGGAVFGIFATAADAERAALEARRQAPDARVLVASSLPV